MHNVKDGRIQPRSSDRVEWIPTFRRVRSWRRRHVRADLEFTKRTVQLLNLPVALWMETASTSPDACTILEQTCVNGDKLEKSVLS